MTRSASAKPRKYKKPLLEAERIGQQMSNVMFNLAQRKSLKLEPYDLETFAALYRRWDTRPKP